MNLKTRLNIALGACAVVAVLLAGLYMRGQLRERAMGEVQREAELHMEAATALRGYTAEHVRPLLNSDPAHFQVEAVPSFAATTAMTELHRRYPGVSYREVALNPTNPSNRATGIHAEIVEALRSTDAESVQRQTSENGQHMLYFAKPLKVKDSACLVCHSTPAAAPPAMLVAYGDQHGFGWKMGETVGAQIVSLPMTVPLERAQQSLWQFLAGACGVVLAVFLALNAMLRRVLLNPIASRHGELHRQAREDELTGAINRRGFLEAAESALTRAATCEEDLSLAMFDIDRFKQINDQHGHAAGDAVLREVVRRVHGRVRSSDLLGRLGGDEFALLLPDAAIEQARILCTMLHTTLQKEPYPHGEPVGISLGVAQWQRGEDLQALLGRADRALYEAKRNGRGRVTC
ncbi:diguanylate cyclase [Ideonella sp. DXS29W]|uniref:diguanylate cyclase n=1 Tax=Ideonella lacteola TaxID=2984193 RepID=A0ABU9BZ16_9BURK